MLIELIYNTIAFIEPFDLQQTQLISITKSRLATLINLTTPRDINSGKRLALITLFRRKTTRHIHRAKGVSGVNFQGFSHRPRRGTRESVVFCLFPHS